LINYGAIYGRFTYGSKLYGEQPDPPLTLWAIQVDWKANGIFETNDADNATFVSIRRGRRFYLRLNQSREAIGFQRVFPGVATVRLNNHDGKYDPFNTASPLYPNVDLTLTKRVKIYGKTKSGDIRSLFTGVLANIYNEPGRNPTTTLEIVDGLQFLSDQSSRIKVQEDIRINEAIDAVLDDVSWPAGWGRHIGLSSDRLTYWWADGRSLDEINDLAEADLGNFFVNAAGEAVFYSRNRLSAPIVTIREDEILKNIPVAQPWESVRNRIRVFSNPLQKQATDVLWRLGDVPEIRAGETREYWAEYTLGGRIVPAVDVVCEAGDFTANAQPDGGGADRTADIAVTLFDFGKTAKLTIENTGGSSAYLTLLRVRGDALLQARSFAEASTAPADRLFTLDLPWLQDSNRTADFSTWLNTFLPIVQRYPTIQIDSRDDLQFEADLFDSMILDVPTLGINEFLYRVGQIEHKWIKSNGQAVMTTLTLEPFEQIEGYWQFTTALGETSILGL